MGKYYLTPGEYEDRTNKQDRNLKVGMWNAEREDKEKDTLRQIAYQKMMQDKADKAKGIGGLAKLGGAAAGAGLGLALAPATGGASAALMPALMGAGLGSELGGAAGGMAGGDAGGGNIGGAAQNAAALLAASKPIGAPPTATPTPEPVGMPFGEAKAPGLTEASDDLALKRKAFEEWWNAGGR